MVNGRVISSARGIRKDGGQRSTLLSQRGVLSDKEYPSSKFSESFIGQKTIGELAFVHCQSIRSSCEYLAAAFPSPSDDAVGQTLQPAGQCRGSGRPRNRTYGTSDCSTSACGHNRDNCLDR